MSIHHQVSIGTNPIDTGTLNYGGLDDTPAGYTDRDQLLAHLGRDVLHGSRTRDFVAAYFTTKDGSRAPRMYRVDSDALGKCEYVQLTSKQFAACMVVDIDLPGSAGGHPINLNEQVKEKFARLVERGLGPAWAGINPVNGKCQAIWLIDPVYADQSGESRHMALLAAATRTLGDFLGHDPNFSHRFSRSPFYTGKTPTAYRWYRQHHKIYRLSDLLSGVRAMTGQAQYTRPQQRFSSGTELILAMKERREEAQRFKELSQGVEAELAGTLDAYDPELVQGVRVLWIAEGRAARDETAFRHALKAAHRLRAAGQRMTDAAIIDAYEHAYAVAQEIGGAGRPVELPPMKDRQTMARRVRGYVLAAKTDTGVTTSSAGRATSTERKALATMGRRGAIASNKKRWEDKTTPLAQKSLKPLQTANTQRKRQGNNTRARVLTIATDVLAQTGEIPSGGAIATELGITRRQVNRHLKALRDAGMLTD